MSAAGKASLHRVFLGIGSNIAPEHNLKQAMDLLAARAEIEEVSSVWESPPVGGEGANFLNAVVLIRTPLPAERLRAEVLRPIEASLGRVRTEDPNAPRTIDLDILLFDDLPEEKSLWQYAYTCVPLAELYPGYTQAGPGLTLAAAAAAFLRTAPIRLRADLHLNSD